MTPDEFEGRQKYTATEIMYHLHECGYCFRFTDTRLPHNPGFGEKCRWGEKQKFIDSLCQLKVPSHFAYIKFYAAKDYEEGADTDANHIFALVAGKTRFSKFYKTDILFSERVEDGPARKWLFDRQNEYLWYLEKVLIFWSPEAETEEEDRVRELAHLAETNIRRSLGLFSS